MTDLLTMKEAAAIVRSTEAALREKWRRLGLPVVRWGRRVLIERAVLEAQLQRTPTKEDR